MNSSYWQLLLVQNPWAFIALMALAVPLVLHLISKSQPKQVKFANVDLIEPLQPKSMRQISVTEFWLLLLRIFLLLISILLLAKVIIIKPLLTHEVVYLVSTDWLNQSNAEERQQLATQSVKQATYLLAPDSKELSAEEIRNWQQQHDSALAPNILLQLTYFSQLLVPETKIKLFVTDRASQYRLDDVSRKPVLPNPIEWQIKTLTSDTHQQYHDVINVVIMYDQERIAELKYFQQAFALLKQHRASKLVLSHFSTKNLDNSLSYQQALQNKPDWLFYLSIEDLDHYVVDALASGANIFVEAQNENVNIMLPDGLITNDNNTNLVASETVFYQWAEPLNIAKQLNSDISVKSVEVLWQYMQKNGSRLSMLTRSPLTFQGAEAGNSVVEKNQTENTQQKNYVYQLHSRFSPSWSNLLVSNNLPLFLQTLLLEQWQKQKLAEQQTLTIEQINQLIYHPDNTGSKIAKSAVRSNATNLATSKLKPVIRQSANQLLVQQQVRHDYWTELLVVLLILLWTLERIISEYFRQKVVTDSKNKQGERTQVEKSPVIEPTKAID